MDPTLVAPTPLRPHPPLRWRIATEWLQPRTWKEGAHAIVALPAGVLWFTWVVTGLSLGFGLAITFFGLPVLWLTLVVGSAAASLERRWARMALDLDVPDPVRKVPARDGVWPAFVARLTDHLSWKEQLYLLLLLPYGTLSFSVVVGLLLTGGLLVTGPLWAIPTDADVVLDGNRIDTLPELVGIPLLGVLLLLLTPWVVHGFAAVARAMVQGLLGVPRATLEERVSQLDERRTRVIDAAAAERQRIERALHDGAQARLVSVAMELGRARERLERGDPVDDVAPIVVDAHEQTKQALVELRDLARGIHPVALGEGGLEAAITSLAGACPVPVEVVVDVVPRPPERIEGAAYFVVAEALTNTVRHGDAARVWIEVVRRGDRLVVEVRDDGFGGATFREGGGLAGLHDRVAALDGHLSLLSPEGGPTIVLAELPCG